MQVQLQAELKMWRGHVNTLRWLPDGKVCRMGVDLPELLPAPNEKHLWREAMAGMVEKGGLPRRAPPHWEQHAEMEPPESYPLREEAPDSTTNRFAEFECRRSTAMVRNGMRRRVAGLKYCAGGTEDNIKGAKCAS
jgi:hypothetical protein